MSRVIGQLSWVSDATVDSCLRRNDEKAEGSRWGAGMTKRSENDEQNAGMMRICLDKELTSSLHVVSREPCLGL
jgi:hypothetical protein